MAKKNVNNDPTDFHTYFNDFDTYVSGNWTVTETGSGSRALTDVDGGCLLITNASSDNDANFLQKVGEGFLFETGKSLYFEARFKVSDATQSDIVMGLQITDTTPLAVSDGIFFGKDDGDAHVDFHVGKNSTFTDTADVAELADNTFTTWAFYYDGATSKIFIFVDDVAVGTSVLTNVVDDEELTVSFGIQNGEAVAKTMTLDYILVQKARIAS